MLSRRSFLGTSIALLGMASGCSSHLPVIRKLHGGVRVNGTVATFDSRIQSGDTIVTDADSSVICVLGDNAYQLGEKTQMQIHWHSLDDSWSQLLQVSYAADEGAVVNTLRLVTGTLTSVFGRGDKKIVVPTAALGIRGTGVFIKVDTDSTYFCTCYGNTQIDCTASAVSTSHTCQQTVMATHHKAVLISHNPNNPTLTPQDLKYHQDTDLHPLAALLGKQLPAEFK